MSYTNKHFSNPDRYREKLNQMMGILDGVLLKEDVIRHKKMTYNLMKLRKGNYVLDVGCGLGSDVLNFSRIVGETGKVFGIDISNSLIHEAKGRAKEKGASNVEFSVCDAGKLNFTNDFFSTAYAERVFLHLAEPEKVLQEIMRVTKPAGKIVLNDPTLSSIQLFPAYGNLNQLCINEILNSVENSNAGINNYFLCKKNGLLDVKVKATVIFTSDFNMFDKIYNATGILDKLCSKKKTTQDQAKKFLDVLINADRKGEFLFYNTLFSTVAKNIPGTNHF